MAEAIVNDRLGAEWEAFSAGTHPTGFVDPRALKALNEIGIQHEGRSKLVDEFQEVDFDLVVTVCDSAAEECPIWLPVPRPEEEGGKGKRLHHSFPDPARAAGSEEQVIETFRAVRDAILHEIPSLLKDQK